MCQMVSEALLRGGPSLASCSSTGFHESSKPSDFSSCSFLHPGKTKGLPSRQRLVARLTLTQKATCSQAILPLLRQEQPMGADYCDVEQQLSSPDRWVENCVCDIVRNINEAPFLHMLFDFKDSTSGVKSQRQRVLESENLSIEDNWREVKDSVKNASPDGVILVHHLDDKVMEGCCMRDELSTGRMNGSILEERKGTKCSKSTNLWGVLVLGKTVAKSACYILKTTSVASSFGTCTQFCLTKAKCFGPSWHDQIQNCWLLSSESSNFLSH
ncbi:hypothetical protein L7F22_001061 [Adiantum nelumboides]|nr:hypothetical protein [Adiantum nelumboides]